MVFMNPFAGGGGYQYDDIFDDNFNFKDINFGALKDQYYAEFVAGMDKDPNTGHPIGGPYGSNIQGVGYAAMKAAAKVAKLKQAQKNFKNLAGDFEKDYGMGSQDFSALMKEVFTNPDAFVGDVGLPSHNAATKSKGFTTKGNFTDFKKRMKAYIDQARSTYNRSIQLQEQEQAMQKQAMLQEDFDKQQLDIEKAAATSGERAERDRAKMASQQYTAALAAGQTPMSTTRKSKGMGVIIPQDRPM